MKATNPTEMNLRILVGLSKALSIEVGTEPAVVDKQLLYCIRYARIWK